MNAHVQDLRPEFAVEFDRPLRDAMDGLEDSLSHIKHLIVAAELIIEHQLGNEAPAAVLMALLRSIEETASKAESMRGAAAQGLRRP